MNGRQIIEARQYAKRREVGRRAQLAAALADLRSAGISIRPRFRAENGAIVASIGPVPERQRRNAELVAAALADRVQERLAEDGLRIAADRLAVVASGGTIAVDHPRQEQTPPGFEKALRDLARRAAADRPAVRHVPGTAQAMQREQNSASKIIRSRLTLAPRAFAKDTGQFGSRRTVQLARERGRAALRASGTRGRR